mmetsp:Transcript_19504/g.28252  ORF Transcript_19504/g.28252 Transcript_19504/m.28252 type:complete len:102 (+) Transcript_19504:1134-1439(+)
MISAILSIAGGMLRLIDWAKELMSLRPNQLPPPPALSSEKEASVDDANPEKDDDDITESCNSSLSPFGDGSIASSFAWFHFIFCGLLFTKEQYVQRYPHLK